MQQESPGGRIGAGLRWLVLAMALTSCGHPEGDDVPGGMPNQRTILFLGDSLTDGFHLDRSEAYPALIEQRLRADGKSFRVINAGISGDTTADGLRRLNGLLRQPVDVLFLALGINDIFRGVPLPEIRSNLQAIMDRTRAANPDVIIVLAGITLWRGWGIAFTGEIDDLYAGLARDNRATLMPDLLAEVSGRRELNLPDDLHPNAQGHAIMAANVWSVLEPVLRDGSDE